MVNGRWSMVDGRWSMVDGPWSMGMKSLHSVVPSALTALFRQGPMSQGKLEVAWRVAVGDGLARVTTVRLQLEGTVEVHTADQRWNKELTRSSSMILTRLIGLLGADSVRRIVVK
jgi:hypothetical protein